MPRLTIPDIEILEAALVGLRQKLTELNTKMIEVKGLLGAAPSKAEAVSRRERAEARRLSTAARERIAAAQRKRWSEFRKRRQTAAKQVTAKRSARKARAKRVKIPVQAAEPKESA